MTRRIRVACTVAAILLGVGSWTAWAQDELFATNFGNNSVTVYTRTANGNVAPLRTISGAATRLTQPAGLAVDTVNDGGRGELWRQLDYGLHPDGQWKCRPAADSLRGGHRVERSNRLGPGHVEQ